MEIQTERVQQHGYVAGKPGAGEIRRSDGNNVGETVAVDVRKCQAGDIIAGVVANPFFETAVAIAAQIDQVARQARHDGSVGHDDVRVDVLVKGAHSQSGRGSPRRYFDLAGKAPLACDRVARV